VAKRTATTGAFAGLGDGGQAEPLFVVVRIDSVRIVFDLPEAAVPFVSAGTRALVRFPALKEKEMPATVSRTAGALDRGTRTLRAEIDLPNPEGKVLPGMFAVVVIPAGGPAPKPGEEPGSADKRNLGDLKALFRARTDAARRAYDEAVKSAQQAKRVGSLIVPVVKPEDVATWSLCWLHAQCEMSDKRGDRMAALAAHLKRMNELQQHVAEMNKNGLASSLDISAVEFHRTEAELWLAREKAKFGQGE
jgi:hypothetical protein